MRILSRLFAVVFVLSVFAMIGAGALFMYGQSQFVAEGPAAGQGDETVVLLDKGLGLKQIATRLERAGVISDKRIFEYGVRLSGKGDALRAGEYAIPSGASMQEVMTKLASGDAILHKLTVAEGLSVAQVLELVEAHEALSGEITREPGEGRLLPETYLFQRGTERDEIIREMEDAKQAVLDELWEDRDEDLPFTTQYEALTLASIVEKETGVAEERPLVASIFVNRLRRNMRLQSDPTIIYGITQGKPLGRRILRSELDSEANLYNTYRHRGLPPTPIANPGKESLKAVLNPPETDYLYFVADGTGGHAFAETLADHNRNVAAWRQVQRERGLR